MPADDEDLLELEFVWLDSLSPIIGESRLGSGLSDRQPAGEGGESAKFQTVSILKNFVRIQFEIYL